MPKAHQLRILHLEDNPQDAELIQATLADAGLDTIVKVVASSDAFLSALEEESFDLVLSDYSVPALDGSEALRIAAEKKGGVPFIFVTGSLGEEKAIDTIKQGATDCVLKDKLARLIPAIQRALNEARDRRERQRAEEALRQSEARTRLIIDTALDAVVTMDDGGQITSWNAQAEKMFGWSSEEALGRNLADTVIPPQYRDGHRRGLRQFLATGWGPVLNKRIEMTALHRDGREFDVELAVAAVQVAGRWTFSAFVRDISARKLAEQRIREQAALLDQARDAIIVRDLDQRITFWNKGAERIYGWNADQALGKRADQLFSKEDSARHEEARRITLEKGVWTGELRQVTKAGNGVIVESRRTLLYNDAGQPKSVLIINTDITDRKRFEAQLLRSQRLESIGTLAGGIAHDLNNVLAPILLAIEVLKAKADPADLKVLATLESSAQRGAGMVRQILTFARGVQGERTVLQLRPLVEDVKAVARETFPRSIRIQTRLPSDLWIVTGDATQLYQVLINLCVNARDAMTGGGVLTLELSNALLDENYVAMHPEAKPGPHVVISVTDTGNGIRPEIMDKIFDPFFTTKETGKGTGLGLPTVLGIVKSHGGFVTVYSEVGKGTEFKVYVPATLSNQNESVSPERTVLPAGRGESILIVDDEPAICAIGRKTLEKFGYKVLTAQDGAEALAVFVQHRADIKLVVTDMTMPIMDGQATIGALRKIDPLIKIIAASGLGSGNKTTDPTKLMTQAFLHKPYTAEKLVVAVNEVLQRV